MSRRRCAVWRQTVLATLAWATLELTIVPSGAAFGQSPGADDGRLMLHDGRVTLDQHADRPMTPASVLKLVVSAAALHHLGPDHRLVTRLRSEAEISEATLQGDLWVEAAGDPTWSQGFFPDDSRAPVRHLARQLRQRQIDTLGGDLVLSTARFAGRTQPSSRAIDEFPYAWAATTSPLAVDDNALRLRIAPGAAVGQPANARLLSAGPPTLQLTNHMHTVGAEWHGNGTVDVLPRWLGDGLVLRGEYPVSEPPYVMAVSHPAPSLRALHVLQEVLAQEGIRVTGELRVTRQAPPREADTLAQVASPALARRLPSILTESNNWQAEMLLLHVALEVDGVGRRDTGLDIARRFLEEQVGLDAASFVLDDASGISPYNLITPRAVGEILRYAWRQPWRGVFVNTLAQPGQGSLEHWGTLPALRGKTGTLRHCVGLAGYLHPDLNAPEPTIFVHMIQQDPTPRPELRARIVRQLRLAAHLVTSD